MNTIPHVTVGVDEVGYGSWAGPLCVGVAVAPSGVLPQWWLSLKDSKRMSRFGREKTDAKMGTEGIHRAIGWCSSEELDRYGSRGALRLAAVRALNRLRRQYSEEVIFDLIIDGSWDMGFHGAKCIVKADNTVPEVSAAAITAKVARDRLMIKLSDKFPEFLWCKNVGYGTEDHRNMLLSIGLTVHHRKSFKPMKDMLNDARLCG